MIYVDCSVVLARLLAEDRFPPDEFWSEALVTSRLLEYEVWARLNGGGLASSHGDAAHALLGRVALLELLPPLLERAMESFPTPVRTLDALHLASAHFLAQRDRTLQVVTYDSRLGRAARAMGLDVIEP
ncbi:MAG: PIN domain-containing protein [Planctomycetota bacterium]|jgi:predicted nucleic acid-binding protein